jgi:predicted secreted protein
MKTKDGVTTGKLIAGVVIAILVASAVSIGLSTQFSLVPQGPKGDKGDAGPQGATGAAGTAGAAGATGPQGAAGSTGATGATGAQGAAGLGVSPGFLVAPAYDSGWVNITSMAGQNIVLTHNLGSSDIVVEIQGRTTATGGIHQKYLGLTDYTSGWSKTYGGTSHDYALGNNVQTNDGGYAISGYTSSFGSGGNDAWLVKTDSVGNIEWNLTYGGPLEDTFSDMIKTTDGGLVLCGYEASFGSGNYDTFLMKVNASGVIVWNQTYGGAGGDIGSVLLQTSDGGYVIVGATNSSGAGNQDVWLVKTDATGTMQWNKTYGGTGLDSGWAVVQNIDGGYTVAGRTASYGAGGNDFWLIKTDTTGNMVWNKTYGGTGTEQANYMIKTSDGGYLMFGPTTSFAIGGQDAWLVKTDASGNMMWNRTYGGAGNEFCLYLLQTSDGGYAFCGSENSFGAGGTDVWLVKTDATGNLLWQKTWGGPNNEDAYSMIQTSDGGYVLVGGTRSFGYGTATPASSDWYVIKTDSEFGLAQIDSTANSVTLYRGATDPYWNFVRVRIWKTT